MSSLTPSELAFLMLAMIQAVAAHLTSLPVTGVLIAMIGLMLLQHGIWHFTEQRRRYGVHAAMLAVAAMASWIGEDPAWRPQQAVVHHAITSSLYLWAAWSLYRYARGKSMPMALVVARLIKELVRPQRRALAPPDARGPCPLPGQARWAQSGAGDPRRPRSGTE